MINEPTEEEAAGAVISGYDPATGGGSVSEGAEPPIISGLNVTDATAIPTTANDNEGAEPLPLIGTE